MVPIRIRYFKQNDYAYGMGLEKVEQLTIPKLDEMDINDAIEFYVINKYFDEGVRLKKWNDEQYNKYKELASQLKKQAMRYFNALSENNIVSQFSIVETYYIDIFLELFVKCKKCENINTPTFKKMVSSRNISIEFFLRQKKIVEKYGSIIREKIISNHDCARILMQGYEQEVGGNKKIYIPDEITSEDINECFMLYINSDQPLFSLLDKIAITRDAGKYKIPDSIRLAAKRRSIDGKNIMLKSGAMKYGIAVSISSQKDCIKTDIDKRVNNSTIIYSLEWLEDTLDYPSILNNFIYIFEFVDALQMRCCHVDKKRLYGLLEKIWMPEGKREYPISSAFEASNMLATIQMIAYYLFLKKHELRLETVLDWFFAEYLPEEFKCPKMRVSMPSIDSTYSEKCSLICIAMETMLKQFSIYVKNGDIDFELLRMSTHPVKFEDIPSLVKNKYYYGVGDDYKRLSYILFSDQCYLSYIRKNETEEIQSENCFQLFINNEVYLNYYNESEQPSIRYLEEHDLVRINEDGLIVIGNLKKLIILKDLYSNEVISKWHYPPDYYPIIDEMQKCGILRSGESLLSEPEVKYLNYYLNDSEFDNGPKLRNSYIHGLTVAIDNEKEHESNYFVLLRLFILLVIKINDDFCLYEQLSEE